MSVLPPAFEQLIETLGKLPGVGPRTAERFAYYIYKHPEVGSKIADDVSALPKMIGLCPKTFALINHDEKVSRLYSDSSRDKTIVAVVSEPLDIVSIERTGSFKGTYHVLGGLISPIDGVNPEQLTIDQLIKRISRDGVKELIFALNASVEGESTALYIQRQITSDDVIITRLARGLPVGVDLEYADQITLGRALEGRTAL